MNLVIWCLEVGLNELAAKMKGGLLRSEVSLSEVVALRQKVIALSRVRRIGSESRAI